MPACTDALTAVNTALTALSVGTVVKQFSKANPPTGTHCVLSVDPGPLERSDDGGFDGQVNVTVDWYSSGAASDGQTQYLAAMDAFETIVVGLCRSLSRACIGVDPGGGILKHEESADLPHWYTGTVVVTFMRREVPSV
jgi:hypothetical protein